MKDRLSDFRIKSRFVLEVKVEPLLFVLDGKSQIIEKIFPGIKKEFPHWMVDNSSNQVMFLDNLANTKNDAIISLHKFAIAMEDLETLIEFKNYFHNFLWPVYQFFKEDIDYVKRIGFRIISVLSNREEDFQKLNDKVIDVFCKKLPVDIKPTDFRIHIVHENGFYLVGPARENEAWTRDVFKSQEMKPPKMGYGIDVDSYNTNIRIKSKEELETSLLALMNISKGIEEQLAISLGILNGEKKE